MGSKCRSTLFLFFYDSHFCLSLKRYLNDFVNQQSKCSAAKWSTILSTEMHCISTIFNFWNHNAPGPTRGQFLPADNKLADCVGRHLKSFLKPKVISSLDIALLRPAHQHWSFYAACAGLISCKHVNTFPKRERCWHAMVMHMYHIL